MGFIFLRNTARNALFILLLLFGIQSAQADIKLAKVEGWSAIALQFEDGVSMHTDLGDSAALVVSWNEKYVLISRAGDQTRISLQSFDPDSFEVHSAVIGDFGANRANSVATLLYDYRNVPKDTLPHLSEYGRTEIVVLNSDITNPNNVDTFSYGLDWQRSHVSWNSYPYPLEFSSIDMNHDGLTELILSVGWVQITSGAWIRENSRGYTLIWKEFDPLLSDTLYYPMSQVRKSSTGPRFFRSYAQSFDELFSPDQFSRHELVHILNYPEPNKRFPSGSVYCEFYNRSNQVGSQTFLVAGDLDETQSGFEVLIRQNQTTYCDASFHLEMFNVNDTLGITSLWQTPHVSRSQYVYHPTRPGKFMAFSGGVLTEFSGETGESIDSLIDQLPGAIIGWYDIYGDGNQYLVTQNDTLLEAYGFDFVTDVAEDDDPALPSDWSLSDPYPNPFNPSVSFSLSVPEKSNVTVSVYNILGQRVTTLHEGVISAGVVKFKWSAEEMPSGLYLIQATGSDSNTWSESIKVILLK